MCNRAIPNEEFYPVMERLEYFDLMFAKLASIGRPMFCDDEFCKTACVTFDKKGKYLKWYFNKKFWDGLDIYNKSFVFCHELLHLLLDHGQRLKHLDRNIGNIAADICINEMLVRNFGFTRANIKNGEDFCWLDTIFKQTKIDPATLSNKETMEYYFNLLYKEAEKIPGGFGGMLVDDHGQFDGMSEEDFQEVAEHIDEEIKGMPGAVKDLVKKIKEGQAKEGKNGKLKGGAAGAMQKTLDKFKAKRKPKWESVIADWKRKALKEHEVDIETWMRISRRYNNVFNTMEDCFLPSEIEYELPPSKRRINVLVVLDSSGSTFHLADRLFNAAKSLNPDRFNVVLKSHDTSIYPVIGNVVEGGGGTSFSIIEDDILDDIEQGKIPAYYDAVFHLTDGLGNKVNMKYPKRWFVFLVEPFSKVCYPAGVKFYNLSDYE